jgi:hypothetical protein
MMIELAYRAEHPIDLTVDVLFGNVTGIMRGSKTSLGTMKAQIYRVLGAPRPPPGDPRREWTRSTMWVVYEESLLLARRMSWDSSDMYIDFIGFDTSAKGNLIEIGGLWVYSLQP